MEHEYPARRGRVFAVLVRRKIRELCLGKAFITMLFLQQTAFFFMQRNALRGLERDGIMVAFHPAQYGLLVSAVLLGIFLLLHAAAEPARERESGALETLFYGPVSAGIYLGAILAAAAAAMLVSILCLLGALVLGVLFIGYEIPASLLPLLPVTFFCFCGMGAAGLFISVLTRQTRPALIIVTVLLICSLAVFAGDFWCSRIGLSGSFAMIFLRRALSMTNRVLSVVFPLGLYFEDLSWFIGYGHIPPLHLLWYPLYGAGLFFASIRVLQKQGVLMR
jgi:ABC-type transport system involved in multi-copper enzyme maturation permease subunit